MKRGGWDFWIMSLAHSLGMTRRQLLRNLDSYELTLWSAYLEEMNNPTPKKQNPEQIAANLKTAFMVKAKGKKRA